MAKPKPILLVEDEENDALFMRLTMKKMEVTAPLQVALDGKQALDYLSGAGEFADREQYPHPCLVLLDLKLPKVPGLAVLKWIREQRQLKDLTVIVLTSSEAEADIAEAYRLGTNSYIVKPVNPGELQEIVTIIKDYWLQGVSPPIDHFTKYPPASIWNEG